MCKKFAVCKKNHNFGGIIYAFEPRATFCDQRLHTSHKKKQIILYTNIQHITTMKKLLVVILAALLSLPSFAQELTPKRNARGKWGYVDTKDNWLIKAKYDVAEEFTPDGFAKVKNSKGK
jgi:hypothetical protein